MRDMSTELGRYFKLRRILFCFWVSLSFFGSAASANATAVVTDTEVSDICRATIAVLMGRDIEIISTDRVDAGIAYVSYHRPDDGTFWENRCRIEGNNVVWGSVNVSGPGTGFGRWRNHPADEIIEYRLNGSEVTIIQVFTDGSRITDTIKLN